MGDRDSHPLPSTLVVALVAAVTVTVTLAATATATEAAPFSPAPDEIGASPAGERAAEAQEPVDPNCVVLSLDDKCASFTTDFSGCAFCLIEVSPDSQTVYVSGMQAFDAETGEEIWSNEEYNFADDFEVSPNGAFLATTSYSPSNSISAAVVDAETGEERWNATSEAIGLAGQLAISHDNERVYVAGDRGLAAYDADNGAEHWVHTINASGGPFSTGIFGGLELSPSGDTLYAPVESTPPRAAAFDTATGEPLWDVPLPDAQNHWYDIDLSEDGRTLALAGGTPYGGTYLAVVDTVEEELVWDEQPRIRDADMAGNVEVGPEGDTVYLTAARYYEVHSRPGSIVAAYEVATGEERWTVLQPDAKRSDLHALAVHPDGSTVYAGFMTNSEDPVLVALDTATGQQQWRAVQPARGSILSQFSVEIAPDGSDVYTAFYRHGTNGPFGLLPPSSLSSYEVGEPTTAPPGTGSSPTAAPTSASAWEPTETSPETTPANDRDQQTPLAKALAATSDEAPAFEEATTTARLALDHRDASTPETPGTPGNAPRLDRQQANLDLAKQAIDANRNADADALDTTFDVAAHAIDARSTLTDVEAPSSEGRLDRLQRGQAALDTSQQLLEEIDHRSEDGLAEAISLAKTATRHQATDRGIAWDASPSPPAHETPSTAALELLDRYEDRTGEELREGAREQLRQLDELPDPLPRRLAEFLDAFLAYDAAVQAAYDDAELTDHESAQAAREGLEDSLQATLQSALQPAEAGSSPTMPPSPAQRFEDSPQATLQPALQPAEAGASPTMPPSLAQHVSPSATEASVDLGTVLPARVALLDAGLALGNALGTLEANEADAVSTIRAPPALAIDLDAQNDTTYEEDYALLVDAGGDNRYANNAGGSNVLGVHQGDCKAFTTTTSAAALFDFGNGDSDYTSLGRSCGVRGGGYGGAGLLVDAGGQDIFSPYHPTTAAPTTAADGDGIDEDQPQTQPDQAAQLGQADEKGETTDENEAAENEASKDRLIVGLDKTPTSAPGDVFHGAEVIETSQALDFLVVETPHPETFRTEATSDPDVAYIEEDGTVELAYEPNDPHYEEQYGPDQIGAPGAWNKSLGDTSRSVCLVDSGVKATHEDISQDRILEGYDFANNDPDPRDGDGHGTHTAGIAAATVDNGIGIAGVGNVGLHIAKAWPDFGPAYVSDIAQGIAWCADNGGDVISMSFGSGLEYKAIKDAVEAADDSGSLLVGAAGNSGNFDDVKFPAAYDEVVAVTCTDPDEEVCDFSSYGPEAELAAPGQGILSTGAGTLADYERLSGTSMSTPYVAGVAALAWSQAGDLSSGELRQVLRDTALERGPPACDALYGHGIVQADEALSAVLEGASPTYQGPTDCLAGGHWGANGGAVQGTGLLVAAGDGDDVFQAGAEGVNGGAEGNLDGGLGALVSGGGDNVYRGWEQGVNGGALNNGAGLLIDAGSQGDDRYEARQFGKIGRAHV